MGGSMKQELYDALTENPIIAAVKDYEGLEHALKSNAEIIFMLYGEVGTIAEEVNQIKAAGKMAMVHMDLISGLSNREEAVNFVKKYTAADGIISTKPEVLRHAKNLSLHTVFRIFAIDSKGLNNIQRKVNEYADLVEILPGLMPKIIRKMSKSLKVPIIAGGLISDKEDVIQALNAGAIAISSSNEEVWKM